MCNTFFVEQNRIDSKKYVTERWRLRTDSRRFGVIWNLTRQDFTRPGDVVSSRPRWGRYAAESSAVQRPVSSGRSWELMGFRYESHRSYDDFSVRAASMPTWFLVPLLTLMTAVPARFLWRERRGRMRAARRQCPACGYDLRGAEHERCPECGAGVERVAV